MSNQERIGCQQLESGIEVVVHKNTEKFPATIVDISQGIIGLISEKSFMPGTEVEITMVYNDDFTLHGRIKRVLLINKEDRFQYQLGIEADQILASEDILENFFLEQPGKDQQSGFGKLILRA